ncbi:hypothetical protein CRV12_02385 [Candidatus Pantoea edessiphila]|uniref:Inner membrane protein YqjE n=1 Tax=Candidatus Pantoea edessiphila TaxID=2044610 RepID=A0A2P5SZU3_9GAMM|nr:phage holin family protein [Candidatus Pantoea edessiphila]PPI87822.1 hypothetical protein CRV12_02385 [Candidatus Pantoea edessiphila]
MNTLNSKPNPTKNILDIGQSIIAKIVGILETRLNLIILEIEEEKFKVLQILLMIGLIFLFASLGFFCLLILILWSVNPQYRIAVLVAISTTLLSLSFIFSVLVFKKSRQSTLLQHSCEELKIDRSMLEDKK